MHIDYNIPIPLFPLNACVLLPQTLTPLHIFEDRYRKMVSHALDSNGYIAMATFKGERWRQEYEGNPPVRPCVCIGYILQHERLPDGRYNILLQGVARAKIVQEVLSTSYREAFLQPLEKEQPPDDMLEPCRDRIEALLADPMLKQWSSAQAVSNWISKEIPTVALIDQMILSLSRCTEQRYTMLAEPCPCQRAEWIHKHLEQTRKTFYRAQNFGCSVSEQGIALN